jgi:hypothetical protein
MTPEWKESGQIVRPFTIKCRHLSTTHNEGGNLDSDVTYT